MFPCNPNVPLEKDPFMTSLFQAKATPSLIPIGVCDDDQSLMSYMGQEKKKKERRRGIMGGGSILIKSTSHHHHLSHQMLVTCASTALTRTSTSGRF
ncbi:unnamed protein product [Linum trigynum]|uniref:Uncharacterized protein n=1 Tax=Linum trigynum TaxID=586398 RepID=A0AAV2D0Y7_9ROSI